MSSRLIPSPLLASCLLHAAVLGAAAVLAAPAPRAPVADALAVELIAPPPAPPPPPPVTKPRPVTKLTPPKLVTAPEPAPPLPAPRPEPERVVEPPAVVPPAAPAVANGNVVAPPEPQRAAIAPVEGGGRRAEAFGRGDFDLTNGSGAAGRSGRGLAAAGESRDVAGAAAATTGGLTSFARPRGGYQTRPAYPETARRAGLEGVTTLRFEVLASGQVGTVLVERSAGHGDLDRAAVEAVRRWRFEPARRGPEAVAVWVTLPVRFELR